MSSFQKNTSTCLTYPSENYSDFDAWSFSEHTSLEQEQPPALISFIAPGDGSVFSRAARGIVMGAPFLEDRENGAGLEMKWEEAQTILLFCSISLHHVCSSPQKLSIMVLTHVQIHGAAWPSVSTLWIMKKSRESRELEGRTEGTTTVGLALRFYDLCSLHWLIIPSVALAKQSFPVDFGTGKSLMPSLMPLAQTDLFKIL